VETCALRGRTRTEMAGARGRHRTFDPADIMTVHGIPVTTPLRTALDLGCALRRRDAMAVLNDFARHHGVTAEELAAELPRYRGRRGVIQLRQLIPLVDPRIESVRESWVWLEICESGLPRPTPQHWILIDGVPTYRLDFAYVAQRIAVEYDGEDFHDGDEQQQADRERREWLRRQGWTVIVVRKGDFTGRRLDAWLAKIRRALAGVGTNRRW
jgi:very-short-patch-repair endonuclease